MADKHDTGVSSPPDSSHQSRVFGGGGRQMVDPPLRVYREGRVMSARPGAPESAKPVYILLTVAAIILGLVALGLNL